ncbi:RNA polymerase sigma factor, partial [Patulibacter medicamentivorans]|uniref:RNA polymerase sigma factor n=1 Tax=Patulibacter medicamentivorans TaxID=1097667 RepID=UPI001478D2E9
MASSLTTLDDAELLRRTAGDPDAFLVVRDRWAPTLEGWLRRRTDGEAHAADVLAETFAQAFQHAGRFRDEADGSAGPWLFGIAANVLRQSWRRTERERRTQRRLRRHDPAAAPAAEDGVAARLDAAATAADLRAALAALPPEQRQAVQLRVIEELPYEEVAGRLACSNDAARLRVSRGLRRMRLLLLVVLTFALLVAVAAATGLLPAVRDVVLGDAQHVRAVDERGEPLLTVRCSGRDGGHRICRTIPGDGPPVIQQAARLRAAGARAAVVESARLCVRGRCREVVAPRVAPPAAPGLLTLHRSSLSLAGPAPRA